MPTNQELRQASFRAVSGTTGTYNEDLYAMCLETVSDQGTLNGTLIAFLQDNLGSSSSNLNDLKEEFAISQGFLSWNEMGTFTPGFSPDSVGGLTQFLLSSTSMSGSTIFDERRGLGTTRAMQPGRAYDFDGVDDYVAGPTVSVDSSTGFSVTFWLQVPSGITDTVINIAGLKPRISAKNGPKITLFDATNGDVNGGSLSADTWHFIAVIYDDGVRKVYQDGTEVINDSITNIFGSGAFSVGEQAGVDGYLDGKLFDVRFYESKALTASNAEWIETWGASGTDPGLPDIWYKCDDTHPTIAFDSSGNGNHGTKTNITAGTFHSESDTVPFSWQNEVGYSAGGQSTTELLTNGTFTSDTSGWTAYVAGTLSWDTGTAKVTKSGGGASNTGIQQNITKPVSSSVRVTGDISVVSGSLTSGTFTVRNLHGTAVSTGLSTSGSFDVILPLDGASATFVVYGYADTITFTLDNLTMKEYYDNSVLLPRDESAPTLDVLGNPLQYSGKAPANASLINSSCGTFDGVNDYVDIGDIGDVDEFEAYVYPTTTAGTTQVLARFTGSTYIRINAGTVQAVNITGATIYVDGVETTAIVANQWQKVRVTFNTIDATDARLGNVTSSYYSGRMCDAHYKNNDANVCHLPFSERSGAIVHDVSGNGNHGTINGATTTPGAGFWANTQDEYHYNILNGFDMVGNFDGTDHIRRFSSTNIKGAAAWIRPDNQASTRYIASFGTSFEMSTNSSGTLQAFDGSFSIILSGGNVPLNVWTHVAIASDTDGTRIYINGVQVDYDSNSIADLSATTFYVGADRAGSNSTEFYGQMKDVYAFDGNVTSAEISALYSNGTAPSNVYLYWPLSDIDTACNDASGNDRNGTLSGTFSIFKGLRIPAVDGGASQVHGREAANSAGKWHNGAETQIDFTGGVAWPGSSGLETAWSFHATRTNPNFNRELTDGGIIARADRFLTYESTLSGSDLTSVQTYTQTKEI